VGLADQGGDLAVVAGEQTVQLDVDPVGQLAAFGDQVVAVVEQGT
jgi:hypothetical protein